MPPTSSEPDVLVVADADDVGAARLVENLSARLRVVWWRLGMPEHATSAQVDAGEFLLEQPGASLSSDDFRRASVVFYRRRLLQPRPSVSSDLTNADDRRFSEREWSSLLDGLLLQAERRWRSTWLNAPSASLLTQNKLALLLRAAQAGLPVPEFTISTPVRFPGPRHGGLVTKAISANEQIDASRYFATALLSVEDLDTLSGTKLPTPCLLQHYVRAEVELRVFYVLGRFLALALTPSIDCVDIRYVPADELQSRPFDLAPELQRALADLARALGLNYCAFDLVIEHAGAPVLIDVTPNGGWDHFESADAPAVTELVADAIAAQCGGLSR